MPSTVRWKAGIQGREHQGCRGGGISREEASERLEKLRSGANGERKSRAAFLRNCSGVASSLRDLTSSESETDDTKYREGSKATGAPVPLSLSLLVRI